MFYKCKHYKIQELVDPDTYGRFGEEAWMFFNPAFLRSADAVRDHFGVRCTINNWLWGGNRKWSGLRPRLCSIGAGYSQHRFGNAGDILLDGVRAEDARKEILEHKDDIFTEVMCLEDEVDWLHMDCRNIPGRIRLVKP